MVKRNEKGQFEKGTESVGGRPKGSKGIASYIKDITNDLFEIVDIAYKIATADAVTATEKQDRRWAIDYLTNRAIGAPKATYDIDIQQPVPIQFVLGDGGGNNNTNNGTMLF